jgi:hypothetical protein
MFDNLSAITTRQSIIVNELFGKLVLKFIMMVFH